MKEAEITPLCIATCVSTQSIEPERELVAQAAAHTRGQRVGHTRGQSIEQERVWREQVVQDKDEGLHARTLQVKELQKVRTRSLRFFPVSIRGRRAIFYYPSRRHSSFARRLSGFACRL